MMGTHRRLPFGCVLLLAVLAVIFLYARQQQLPQGDPFRHDVTELERLLAKHHHSPRHKQRQAFDGKWLRVGGSREVHVYSAFYDDRRALGSLPVVRVIAVVEEMDEEADDRLFCVLSFPDIPGPTVIVAHLLPIGAGVHRHHTSLKEVIITCPMDREDIPANVSVVLAPNHLPAFRIPVEVPPRSELRDNFMVCVSISYWYHDPHRLVEWVELLRIFGADRITVYNNSLAPESSKVFQYYSAQGIVDFRQSHNFIPDSGEETIHLHMSPVINDCMYRNMYTYRKVVVVDLDEVIVPHINKTYMDMLATVDKVTATKHPAKHYVFRNAYFFLDLPGMDRNQSLHLTTLRHRQRLPPSPPGYAVKSIVDPLACTNMHNHVCWGETALYERVGDNVQVPTEIALNHHYKKCHLDRFEGPGRCLLLHEKAIQDDVMMRFHDELIQRVQPVLQDLQLEPV